MSRNEEGMSRTTYTIHDPGTGEFTMSSNLYVALLAWFNLYNRTGQESEIVIEHPSGNREKVKINELFAMLPDKYKKSILAGQQPPPGLSLN
jgi:hypothetical protein